MRLALLGPVALVVEGEHHELASRRLRQLLAILALSRNRAANVDTICELIWGEDPPADPAATVQTYISRLRGALDPPISIDTSPTGYVLRCPDDHLDSAEFEEIVAQVRRATAEAIPALVESALVLWRGRPLGDLDHPHFAAERQRLTELRAELGEAHIEALTALGRHEEAIPLAEQHIRMHPYRERAVADLMRCLYGSGRQVDALAVFAQLRTRLLDDLGVDPSTDLRELELKILQQDMPPAGRASNRGPAPPAPLSQSIRFAHAADGTRLAYATSGEGPPLVKAANWMTHLDYDWESPVWQHWNTGLSEAFTLVRYDERGCGLSDRDIEDFSFEAWVTDLEVVVDTLDLERFPLLGISQGAAVAIAYAVRHPDRVSHLILAGAYPRGRLVRATTDADRKKADLNLELARVGWGTDDPTFRQVFTSQFMPDGTKEHWEAFNELQRRTCSVENAIEFMKVFAEIDVSALAPQVTCPTLVMHSRDELRVPMSNALEIASLIPNSELVLLESRNHIIMEHEAAWSRFLEEINRFVN